MEISNAGRGEGGAERVFGEMRISARAREAADVDHARDAVLAEEVYQLID
jgi:hypothetical protein